VAFGAAPQGTQYSIRIAYVGRVTTGRTLAGTGDPPIVHTFGVGKNDSGGGRQAPAPSIAAYPRRAYALVTSALSPRRIGFVGSKIIHIAAICTIVRATPMARASVTLPVIPPTNPAAMMVIR